MLRDHLLIKTMADQHLHVSAQTIQECVTCLEKGAIVAMNTESTL